MAIFAHIFGGHDLGRGSVAQVGRGQGCCSTSSDMQDGPSVKEDAAQSVRGTEVDPAWTNAKPTSFLKPFLNLSARNNHFLLPSYLTPSSHM